MVCGTIRERIGVCVGFGVDRDYVFAVYKVLSPVSLVSVVSPYLWSDLFYTQC